MNDVFVGPKADWGIGENEIISRGIVLHCTRTVLGCIILHDPLISYNL